MSKIINIGFGDVFGTNKKIIAISLIEEGFLTEKWMDIPLTSDRRCPFYSEDLSKDQIKQLIAFLEKGLE